MVRRLRAAFFPAPLLALGCALPTAEDADGGAALDLAVPAPLTLDTPLLPPIVIAGEPLAPAEGRTLGARLEQLGVPGVSVAVFDGGEVLWAGGFGLADVESGRRVTTETLFQAASISKPVAAMGALSMVQGGALTLGADVNDALVSWQVPANEFSDPADGDSHPVTLRDLLSHTAGLTVHGFPGYQRTATIPSTVDVLDGRGNTPPVLVDLRPGSTRRYSGGGFTVAQLLMVDCDDEGRDFATLMAETVLTPIGMVDSTFAQPLPAELHDRAATAYGSDGSPIEGSWHVYPEQAAAGMWTTPTDLARFALAIQRGMAGEDGPVLDAEWVRAMCTAPVEPGYGLGLSLGAERFGHGGGNMGFRCVLTAFFDGGGVVVMSNSDDGWPIGQEILSTLFDHYGWSGLEPTELTVVRLERAALDRVAGRYEIPEWGSVEISVADTGDRLIAVSPDGESFVLRSESELIFFDPADGIPVEFLVDEETGAVTGFAWDGIVAVRSS